MRFNEHSKYEGRHAFLSPSSYHWLNYDVEKLTSRFYSWTAAKRGTDLHDLAHTAIKLGVNLDSSHDALAAYVSDAIELNMACEQTLVYSDNCFGSADSIVFMDNTLRIHDLKTGITASNMKQLKVYAALFCLEYGVTPYDIEIELRIYQREEVRIETPTPEDIEFIMTTIIDFDSHLEALKGDGVIGNNIV